MAAPKGNQYHKGGTEGRPLIFNSPNEYRNAIQRYFDWCDENPIQKNEALKSGVDAGRIIKIPTQRPYLIEGLCDFLDISLQTFYNYEKNQEYKDFFEVAAWARNKVFTQNLSFGYVGGFDAGLVARKLGIADRQEMEMKWENSAITISLDGNSLRANLKISPPVDEDAELLILKEGNE
jgi:hypothetical protein